MVYSFWDDQPVSTEDWIVHRIGWTAGTEAAVADFLANHDLQVWIDGTPVDEAATYWGDITEIDGTWVVKWCYTTPPKLPGTYAFRVRYEFTADLDDGAGDQGEVIDHTGTYTVAAAHDSHS